MVAINPYKELILKYKGEMYKRCHLEIHMCGSGKGKHIMSNKLVTSPEFFFWPRSKQSKM